MGEGEKIRKVVGKGKPKRPLQRAFELRQMMIDLRGPREDDNYGHIRKTVGRAKPKQG
jgi:hypothetical protein